MTETDDACAELLPLPEAERICRDRLGMTQAEFRHELAEHVRGGGGIPWVATETAAGVHRAALEALLGDVDPGDGPEHQAPAPPSEQDPAND
jgi:hypothetical protein